MTKEQADRVRRLPVGAEQLPNGLGVHFRVWASKRRLVRVVLDDRPDSPVTLEREAEGYFAGLAPRARAGTLYRYQVDDDPQLYPDPVSRYQPQGVHGPSQVVDADEFRWTDGAWAGINSDGQILYEMHVGTFTKEGTWAAAAERLEDLRDLGITCVEVMPVNEFAGRWGWGYDGVQLFAPYHHYGTPDDMRRFIDRAHAVGLGVILDVVYNHLGPDGNYASVFSDQYFSPTHQTDWGDAMNFDAAGSRPVREFFLCNVRMWIEEYHLDGFRFDATQALVDESERHILAEITEVARRSAGNRAIYLVNENEPQHTQLVRPIDGGGCGMDALWNDDFHHAAMVAMTGHSEAYYCDYRGAPQEFISAAKWGYLYQGQRYKWHERRRGTPALDLPPTAFIHFIQNHDQIANTARGDRLHKVTSPGELRAMTALLLLMPQTPMLFQGQEFAASSPFYYFSDHHEDLSKLIAAGRAKEIAQFPSAASPLMQEQLVDPSAPATFERSKIDHSEADRPFHAEIYRLHKELLRLRREEPAFKRVQRRGDIDGAVLGAGAFVLRFFGRPDHGGESGGQGDDRLLIVNLGQDLALDPAPEPLLGAPPGRRWFTIFSSEDPCYGGSGTAPLETEAEGWHIPGRTTVLLRPVNAAEAVVATRFRVAPSCQEAKHREQSV
ncbi:malto-oligosyltrehalose trehalohydrolase [Humisphaera borealis]|uniref:Malto-oligosyltrehalose trehalohydrolase n=1 Tax=Humisphaera borealis TaxID=2807512 RepID=A0A7M2X5N8_9BACT|nr:malto-oligosyltrehalose trehalohydrolase [Humisphaera borealis]